MFIQTFTFPSGESTLSDHAAQMPLIIAMAILAAVFIDIVVFMFIFLFSK
jgi:hypothetical protein